MSTPTSEALRAGPVLGLLLLAACGQGEEAQKRPLVPCRPAGATAFETVCLLERRAQDLTLRHPDGRFRRLQVTTDGRGVIAADGAEQAVVMVVDGSKQIEVALGGDHYRLPAKVGRK